MDTCLRLFTRGKYSRFYPAASRLERVAAALKAG